MIQMLGQAVAPSKQAVELLVSLKTRKTQSPRLSSGGTIIWAMVLPRHSLLGGGTFKLSGGTTQYQAASGGTTQCRQWYCPYPEISEIYILGSKFESIWGL